jgi:hypothetical protein
MSLIAEVSTLMVYGRFGGMNKGRPNSEDLKYAEDFASKLMVQTHKYLPKS